MKAFLDELRILILAYMPVEHLVLSAAIALTAFVLSLLWYRLNRKRRAKSFALAAKRALILSCLMGYLYALFYVTLLGRADFPPPNPGRRINLAFFSISRYGFERVLRFTIYNTLLFMPLSFLLPCVAKAFEKAYVTIPICVLTSIAIEVLQYSFRIGIYELDDMLFNSLGAILGFVLYLFASLLYGRKKPDKEPFSKQTS